ncbi:Benzoyl-CoA reductase/2-hydroxyglutaryl-CoA dehydratase subunit, BcrC/BadD/HgdB [Archaeoglobus sulfaticallidus PM70-1]|uniref:Benzoyl-CoA reductase/2-hydroxyglutaryl-CoA dehydratase subunit, BcrC/BadD/HgdB n=1 Tax=Archaeoglobus sulfaticallidus PM70-1 TaxID=387631 RepID=N0BCF4_9EURY|nr:2-hydroxyacyl-CoA dehydratase [Archaeoglobus sulfaticallidus]AGK60678.1 Benzoyl-CoA reductase/2-hydroxyglutaryl-CoA dehydratase subunit, BcrC/BadD/HgdB [Archaeoglobus sulfaticallidus PM70-1]
MKSTIKKLNATSKMRELMLYYYLEGKQAEIVSWVTSGAPVEFLYAMDIYPAYPENHSALIGANKTAPEYCELAERNGYSQDLCSYARCDIGAVFAGTSPIGGLPKPNFLFACNNICNTVVKWYEVLGRIFKVPVFLLDVPFVRKELKESHVDYVESQLYDFVDFLEKISGREFDEKKFRKVLELSREGVERYKDVLYMGRNKPSPLTCFDAFLNMAPIVCLRGTEKPVEFYSEMKKELEERIKNEVYAVDDEKYRLLWDNIPVWYRLKWLSEFFIRNNACMVADTYTNAWTGFLSADSASKKDVMRSIAETYTKIYLNIGLDEMVETINRLIDLYDVDGVVIHSNRSCKPYSFGQYEIKKMLDVPAVIIEADMTDPRAFSEAQIESRLEAFLEIL